MEFEYKPVPMFDASVDIENIAQCALEVLDNQGQYYYLVIRTIMGVTTVFQQGPVHPDVIMVLQYVNSSITRFEYDANKIKKIIKLFIADRLKGANKTEVVRELPITEALSNCFSLVAFMQDLE